MIHWSGYPIGLCAVLPWVDESILAPRPLTTSTPWFPQPIELLTDNYTSDQKLTFKTTTAQKVTYTVTGVQDADTNLIAGDVSMKMGVAGHAVTTKLFTSGKLTSEVTLDRLGVEGLSVKVLGALSDSGAASAGASAEWNTPSVSATIASDLSSKPTLRATAVAGHGGVYVGGETAYDTAKNETTVADLSVSYADRFESEINVQLLKKGTRALLSYGHEAAPGFAVAAQYAYDLKSHESVLTAGTNTLLADGGSFKVKVDSLGLLSVALKHTLHTNTTLVLSTSVDLKSEVKQTSKVGIALCIE